MVWATRVTSARTRPTRCSWRPTADGLGDGLATRVQADPLNDWEGNSVCGNLDNCPDLENPGQLDSDGWNRVFDFDYSLNSNGDEDVTAGYLNDGAWLDPDKAVHFERRGATGAIIDGGGFLRFNRSGYEPADDRYGMVLHDPLPETYVFSIEDIRRHPPSGFYLAISVSYTNDDSLPILDRDLLPRFNDGLFKMRIVPNGYYAQGGQFLVLVAYTDRFGGVWGWNSADSVSSWFRTLGATIGIWSGYPAAARDHQGEKRIPGQDHPARYRYGGGRDHSGARGKRCRVGWF